MVIVVNWSQLFTEESSNANETSLEIRHQVEERHKELMHETVEVGVLFASKAFVQLLSNPIVGPLTHRWVETQKQNESSD